MLLEKFRKTEAKYNAVSQGEVERNENGNGNKGE